MSIAALLDVLVEKEESKVDNFLGSIYPLMWSPSTPDFSLKKRQSTTDKGCENWTRNVFNEHNLDMLVTISSFLTAEEMHTFRLINRFTKHVFTVMAGDWSCFWKRELMRQFGTVLPYNDDVQSSFIVKYLTYHQRVLETEYKHFMSAERFYICFHEYCTVNQNPGIIGLVCDIGYVDDPIVAAVLSRKRYMTMLTVLTEHEKDVHKFKKTLTTTHESAVSRIRSFLPVMSAKGIVVDSDLERVIGSSPDTFRDVDGFIGYAVQLIKLRKEHEYMRYSVFWGLFRDLMVFETREKAERYGTTLTLWEYQKFWFTCLDDYSLEELDNTYPRFRSLKHNDRESYVTQPPKETKRFLERRIAGARYSHSIAKYTY